ncbi:hypothetical protein ONQ62_27045, partial [Salmonella enterica subsp. enterica serovar Virginia]|nr:hypothetical protein [Salmonella enterica subsp. enterica serovar Virginia]
PDESAIADAKNTKNMLGYVALELDLKSVRLQQYKEIFISSVMNFITLIGKNTRWFYTSALSFSLPDYFQMLKIILW